MATNFELKTVSSQGWLQGFPNLFSKESYRWWRTRFWFIQLVIWLVIINGVMALIYSMPAEQLFAGDPQSMTPADQQVMQEILQHPEQVGLITFVRLVGIATVIGVVVIAQDAIISEKHSGTAAWVLSKPVSRSALVLAKLAGSALGIFGVMGVLLGAAAYGQIGLMTGVLLPVLPFAGMLGLLFLYQLFYLTLTIMLGTLFNNRGAVLGIPLVLIFGYQIMLGIAPWLGAIMPWNLVTTLEYPALALAIAQGNPLPTATPLLATLAWCILFTLIAVWRFSREEF